MLNFLVSVGSYPEVIKMGPVVRAFSQNSHRVSFKVCVTSQHREMGLSDVRLTPPLSDIAFVDLLQESYLVLTDSSGVQEEAPNFGVPTLYSAARQLWVN